MITDYLKYLLSHQKIFAILTLILSVKKAGYSQVMQNGVLTTWAGYGSYLTLNVPAGQATLQIYGAGSLGANGSCATTIDAIGNSVLYYRIGQAPCVQQNPNTGLAGACSSDTYSVAVGQNFTFQNPAAGNYYFLLVPDSSVYGVCYSAVQATYTAYTPPIITSSPQSQFVLAGGSVTLSVGASGQNVSYSWSREWSTNSGSLISGGVTGATSSTLIINNVQAGVNDGYYTACAYNTGGQSFSAGAYVTAVNPDQSVVGEPQNVITAVGYPASIQLFPQPMPLGSLNSPSSWQWLYPAVQWQMNGSSIIGATNIVTNGADLSTQPPPSFIYSITNVQSSNIGIYNAVLSYPGIAGNIASSNSYLSVISAYKVITIAGLINSSGTNDGPPNLARFNQPEQAAFDSYGNLYISDTGNRTIRKLSVGGTVSTFAGLPGVSGTNDGVGDAARFNSPYGIAIDKSNNLFVADLYGCTIRKITPYGSVTTIAGLGGVSGTNDGINNNARFNGPYGIAVDGSENLFVADQFNHVIRKVTPTGTNWIVSTIAGSPSTPGYADGTNANARFSFVNGIALSSNGVLYVDDSGTFSSKVREITPVGTNWLVTTIVSNYNSDFHGITISPQGNIFVSNVEGANILKITPDGTNWLATPIAGATNGSSYIQGTNDGIGITTRFFQPGGITLDWSGNLFVIDGNGIRKGWSSDAAPTITLQAPVVTNGQIYFNIISQTGSPSNFTLLQANSISSSWTTNSFYHMTTNVNGYSYSISAPFGTAAAKFYRVQHH